MPLKSASREPFFLHYSLLRGAALVLSAVLVAALAYLVIVGRINGFPDGRYYLIGGVIAVALLPLFLLPNLTRLWQRQFSVLLMLSVYSLHMMAIDAGPINPLNVTLFILTGAWLLHRLASPDEPIHEPAFSALVISFMAVALVSALDNAFADVFGGLVTLLPKLMFALVLADVIRSRADLELVLRILLISSALAALLGIGQLISYLFLGWELHLMDEDAPRFITLAGMPLLRASGLAHTPQGYAQPLLVVAVLLAYRLWYSRPRTSMTATAALLGLLLAGLTLSFARGQWVAALGALLVMPLIARPHNALRWLGSVTAVALLGLLSGVVPLAYRLFSQFSSSSAEVRVELLRAGLDTAASHPLNGVGIGNFGPYSPTVERYPVHNSLVQVASEMGYPALLLFALILIYVAWRLVRALRHNPNQQARDTLKALLTGYIALFVAIQADPMAYSEFVWFYLAFAIAASRILRTPPAEAAPETTSGKSTDANQNV